MKKECHTDIYTITQYWATCLNSQRTQSILSESFISKSRHKDKQTLLFDVMKLTLKAKTLILMSIPVSIYNPQTSTHKQPEWLNI